MTAIAVVVGNVIGSGIFLKPGNIAAEAGSFPLIIGVWLFGGALCILGALCFAELATMLPQAGGIYVYLRQAYGPLIAFLFGWTELFFVRPASVGALSVAFAGSFLRMLDRPNAVTLQVTVSILLIILMTGINVAGVVWGGRVQLATTLIKVIFLLLIVLSPFVALPFLGWTVDAANYSSTVVPRQTSLSGQIGVVLLSVMWAYNGWHAVTPLSEEIHNPQRTIPISLLGGVGILIVLYVGANIAYHGVMSMEEMKLAGDHAAEQLLQRLAGRAGQLTMSAVIMCSTFGALNTDLLQAPRVTLAMGRDRTFFPVFARVHAGYRTPVIAIFLTSAMAICLIVAVNGAKLGVQSLNPESLTSPLLQRIVGSLADDSIFDLLTNFVIFAASVFYLLAVVALIILRVKHPEWERPYRTWGYPIVPILFIASYIWFLAQVYGSSPLESRTGLLFIAAGIPIYFGFRRRWLAA
ncbi:MAG: amino acid permease [Planctomycetales bacterium]|nr:amino acid permease [Planctomycetales bacterium]